MDITILAVAAPVAIGLPSLAGAAYPGPLTRAPSFHREPPPVRHARVRSLVVVPTHIENQ